MFSHAGETTGLWRTGTVWRLLGVSGWVCGHNSARKTIKLATCQPLPVLEKRAASSLWMLLTLRLLWGSKGFCFFFGWAMPVYESCTHGAGELIDHLLTLRITLPLACLAEELTCATELTLARQVGRRTAELFHVSSTITHLQPGCYLF